MKVGGSREDAEYSLRARKALSDSLDIASLCYLAQVVPNLLHLIDDIDMKTPQLIEANLSQWKLVFLLCQFMNALLDNNRPIMLILDDLQWAESLILELVLGELLECVGDGENAHRFLFVGLYRNNEVSDGHPLYAQLVRLRKSASVNVTEICLPAFSKGDMSDMIAAELRLPTRIVSELGDVVHRKTSGHILFAVELLNSMLRDSTIYFGLNSRRYCWRWEMICSLKTDDNVASFIISTLSTLPPETLHTLRILACFGFHSDQGVLELLDASCVAPSGGLKSCIQNLVNIGVIEIVGGLVSFTHDLIQQNVYEDFELHLRQNLHYDIGVFLGAKVFAKLTSTETESLEIRIDQMYISESKTAGESVISERSLLSIATDHINSAGPDFIVGQPQKELFAKWNLLVGKEMANISNFGSALHYYEEGIRFVGDGVWLDEYTTNDKKLCFGLYEGAAAASLATRKCDLVEYYTSFIFQHASFEKSLPSWIILMLSIESLGRYNEVLEKGINLFRRLGFVVPLSPPGPTEIMASLLSTSKMASSFNLSQIEDSRHYPIDDHKRNLFKLYTALIISTYALSSPYLPLLSFEMVQYSLRNTVFTPESAVGEFQCRVLL